MIDIRPERPGDETGIDAVHREAFPGDGEAKLVAQLRTTGAARVSWVAAADGEIVGHVVFSPVTAETNPDAVVGLGLAPLAVRAAWRKQGVGARLVEAGLTTCRESSVGFVVVLGDASYYPRFGFRRAADFGLGNEYGADEHFMVIETTPGALRNVRGVVRYGPAFAVFAE
jgi:putative acetyltransferase